MHIKKLGALLLSLAMLVGMLAVGFVMPAAADETDVEIFHANLSINKNGGGQAYIDNNTGGARDYLLSKFAFYRNQEGMYFERPLVNGYVADENGNSITAPNATQTTPAFAPDTGLAMDGDQYIDYTGNGAGPMAFWGLEWNYLFCTDRSDTSIDFYRNSNWMYVKDANGDLATLKNFRVEILFLPHQSTTQNTVAVTFRSATAGNVIAEDETAGDRQLVSIDPKNGGLYFGNSFVRNTSTHSESLGGALEKTWYVLTVEAVEGTLTVTVKKDGGDVVYTTTKTLNILDSGYLGIGGSMNGVAYRDIKITRLDKDGNAVDFNDENDGWDFKADFTGLGTFRADCQWLMGSESAVLGYYRDNGNTDFAWLEKVNSDSKFWFLNEMNAENAYDAQGLSELNSKFDLSFEGQGWARSTGKTLETQFSGHSQVGTARLALFNGRFLNAVYSNQGTDGQNNIQKALGLRPLKADGTAWSVKNFETTFVLNFNTSQATSATALYFRAQNANSFAANASAGAIVFSGNGYQLFDGAGPGNKYDYNAYTAWNGGATNSVRVYVKVVDTNLVLKVTSVNGATVYADTTATISDGNAGYLYYTLINGNNAISSIAMNEITAPAHTCDFATPDFDANGHWNECGCGEKDAVIPHETEYVIEGDKHYETCDCGYETEKVGHEYEDGFCDCGHEQENVAILDTANKEIVVKPEAGFELKAGSLLVKDAGGNYFVPERVGFREGGDADTYVVNDPTFNAEGATVEYEFIEVTLNNPNIGNVGNSINEEVDGLRFVSRFTRKVEAGVEYVVLSDGTKYEIADYGMLMSSQPGLATTDASDEEDMVVDSANKYVSKQSILSANKYYDVCDDYLDMSVCITGIDKLKGYDNPEELDIYARAYVVVKVDAETTRVLYGEIFSCAYADAVK